MVFIAVLIAFLIATIWLWLSGALDAGLSREVITAWVDWAGPFGPVVIIGFMTAAVVASPIPSAPIAVAAGVAYGHGLGTALVAIGAELGALLAFLIARWLGRDALRRWFGDKLDMGLLGSQNALMLTVFTSRLMPFVSFDMLSYAAGLTRLQFWRFALATLAGLLPASFVLAHLGSQITETATGGTSLAVIGLGLLTGAPLIWLAWKRKMPVGSSDHELSQINATGPSGPKLLENGGNPK